MKSRTTATPLLFLVALILLSFGLTAGLVLSNLLNFVSLLHYISGVGVLVVALFRQRNLSSTFKSLLPLIMGFCLLVSLIVGSTLLSLRYNRTLDLTAAGVFTLSAESAEILSGVKQPLKLYFVDDQNAQTRDFVSALLRQYSANNPLVSYQIVNKNRETPRQFINLADPGTLYFEYGADPQSAVVAQLKIFSESEITKSVQRLINPQQGSICYAFGHGEPHGDETSSLGFSELTKTISALNYQFRAIFIKTLAAIPRECRVLILTDAEKSYSRAERAVVRAYHSGTKSRILVLANPESPFNFNFVIRDLGVEQLSGHVIDRENLLQGADRQSGQLLVKNFVMHPVTERLIAESTPVVFNQSAAFRLNTSVKTLTALLQSGNSSSLVVQSSAGDSDQTAESSMAGPFVLGVAHEQGEQRLVALGDLDWLRNESLDLYGNRLLFVQTLNWLAEDKSVSLPPLKLVQSSRLRPLAKANYHYLLLLTLLLPELLILILLSIKIKEGRQIGSGVFHADGKDQDLS